MTSPLIVLDIDGVLADFMYGFEKAMGEPPLDLLEYNLFKAYPNRGDDVKVHLEDPSLYAKLPVVFGAKKAVKWLRDAGFELKSITARPNVDGMEAVTRAWIKKHFKKAISEVYLVPTELKARLIADMFPALALDDSPANIRDLQKHKVRGLLFSQIYNIREELPRVQSWAHLIRVLKETR